MLFKYSGKYVNIYFNMKITFLLGVSLPFRSGVVVFSGSSLSWSWLHVAGARAFP